MHYEEGNKALIAAMENWNIRCAFGVNGGGIIHLLKYVKRFSVNEVSKKLRFFTLSEYAAGFAPIGYYLSSEQTAACITTTGAAIKLAASGLSDARFMRIPALYIFSLNNSQMTRQSPLQDVGEYGMNIVPQLKAEFGDAVQVLKNIDQLPEQLNQIASVLSQSRPAVFLFYPDILCQPINLTHLPSIPSINTIDKEALNSFICFLKKASHEDRRLILYVCAEAGFQQKTYPLIEKLKNKLGGIVVCTVNGSSAAGQNTSHHYGHIGLGGNERANKIWNHLNEKDILICLGMEAGEYHFPQNKLPVGDCWCFTRHKRGYGFIDGSYQHRFKNNFNVVHGPLHLSLSMLLEELEVAPEIKPFPVSSLSPVTKNLVHSVEKSYVDLVDFYQNLSALWKKPSIGFDDVCISYRDRQCIMEVAHPNIRFFSAQDGSAMGGAFGMLIGAKATHTNVHCFGFSGDGCWRLYGGALAEVSRLGIVLFIMNNNEYHIVRHGLDLIIPGLPSEKQHAQLNTIDFVMAAKAHGWQAIRLKPDLSNLKDIMKYAYSNRKQSLLIDVPVDPNQALGSNPRYQHLTKNSFL
ncbi:thiamine pyrophosphate-dependent enzyme [Legionella israelensis]|uniref:Acetolactate synthase isozyme 2 large subunit n=1 Tax=Legionella israelensis TaxID=454 RepID=A0A0W0VMV5_9GAMM|nr:thiamine pyrophosphate-dependent enzyme [Legionella israelensis]KTD21444.1 Acetolactate synthase isozyme 2 large subunit [Legionella israelensis]QBS08443.1 thiamine pyrophosphate-binding protein [Legionella israelensis]SCY15627.1 acetolactate synthase-1/2/3 large subunit [Legionella israelensis DSM 19235]STX58079.1 Acetolactate synthase isozyme 2 large subunit [Legionella israelensis]